MLNFTIQRIFAVLVALILLVLGVWGFFSDHIMGLFALNIGHAMLHIILGLGGIVMIIGQKPANFNGTAGYLLSIFGILGMIPGINQFLEGMLNINRNTSLLWLGLGFVSLIVYFLRIRPKRDPETNEVINEEETEEVSTEETISEPTVATETSETIPETQESTPADTTVSQPEVISPQPENPPTPVTPPLPPPAANTNLGTETKSTDTGTTAPAPDTEQNKKGTQSGSSSSDNPYSA